MVELFWLSLLALPLGGILSIGMSERYRGKTATFFVGLSSLGMIGLAAAILNSGIAITFQINYFQPLGTITFVVDALSAFFILMIGLISLVTSLYSLSYLKDETSSFKSTHYFFLNLLVLSMYLVVSIQHSIAFLMAWELMSISSFFLVGYDNDSKQVNSAALSYLIATHLSLVFLMISFIILNLNTGSQGLWALNELYLNHSGTGNIVFGLAWIGFALKAGFFPFHTWLPQAHPAAPSHVSALMSGIMIKTGIYGMLRLVSFMPAPSIHLSVMVLTAALLSGIIGILYALAQNDLKKSLAYSSIENIGIIGLGMGIGMLGLTYDNPAIAILGFSGCLLHTLNHSLFKTTLFLSAGAVYRQIHTRNLEKMGGLAQTMPITAAFFLISSLAISGLPPLNGFISEFLIYMGLYQGIQTQTHGLWIGSVISVVVLALIGAMSLFAFVRSYSMVFQGFPRYQAAHQPQESPRLMRIAMLPLIISMVLIGIFPQWAVRVIQMPLVVILPDQTIPESTFTLTTRLSYGMLGLIALCLILYVFRYLLLKNKKNTTYKTWDCGYQAPNPRMQYTASSFANPIVSLFSHLYVLKEKQVPVSGLFPQHASLKSTINDWLEEKIVNPVLLLIQSGFCKLLLFQSGQAQQYILFGLIFLLMAIIWIIGTQ